MDSVNFRCGTSIKTENVFVSKQASCAIRKWHYSATYSGKNFINDWRCEQFCILCSARREVFSATRIQTVVWVVTSCNDLVGTYLPANKTRYKAQLCSAIYYICCKLGVTSNFW